MSERQITGRQVFFVVAGAFSIIIAVNFTMAFQAVSTFPGLETKNSYVASQQFQERREAQEALGWDVAVAYEAGEIVLAFTDSAGSAVHAENVDLLVGRKTNSNFDEAPTMNYDGSVFRGPVALDPGFWTVRLTATDADGTHFRKRLSLRVRG